MNVFWPVSRKKNWLNVAHWPFKWVCFRGTVPMHLSSLNPQSSKWKNTKREFTQLKAPLTIRGHTDVREINSPIHIWYAHRNSLSDTITQQTQPFKTHFTIYLPLFFQLHKLVCKSRSDWLQKVYHYLFFPPSRTDTVTGSLWHSMSWLRLWCITTSKDEEISAHSNRRMTAAHILSDRLGSLSLVFFIILMS